jgi:hypothetical protein
VTGFLLLFRWRLSNDCEDSWALYEHLKYSVCILLDDGFFSAALQPCGLA